MKMPFTDGLHVYLLLITTSNRPTVGPKMLRSYEKLPAMGWFHHVDKESSSDFPNSFGDAVGFQSPSQFSVQAFFLIQFLPFQVGADTVDIPTSLWVCFFFFFIIQVLLVVKFSLWLDYHLSFSHVRATTVFFSVLFFDIIYPNVCSALIFSFPILSILVKPFIHHVGKAILILIQNNAQIIFWFWSDLKPCEYSELKYRNLLSRSMKP